MGCGNGVWEKPKDGEKDIHLKRKRKKTTQSGFGNNSSPLPPGRINEKKSAHHNVFLIMFPKTQLCFT